MERRRDLFCPAPDPAAGADHFQVDFVVVGVEERLGETENDYYGRQNRLIQYAHITGDEVVERDTWMNSLPKETHRRFDNLKPIEVSNTVPVSFDVSPGEGGIELSLAAYTLPDGRFSFDTAADQELVDLTTGSFPPGEHTLSIEDIPIRSE